MIKVYLSLTFMRLLINIFRLRMADTENGIEDTEADNNITDFTETNKKSNFTETSKKRKSETLDEKDAKWIKQKRVIFIIFFFFYYYLILYLS